VVALCFAGGMAQRFYPLGQKLFRAFRKNSRLPVFGSRSLFQERLQLFATLADKIVVVGSSDFGPIIEQQVRELEAMLGIALDVDFVPEAERRDTGPAAWMGLEYINTLYSDDPIIIMGPSDHYHAAPDKMAETLKATIGESIRTHMIGSCGVHPRTESDAFSYLVPDEAGLIRCFVQKPSSEDATNLIDEGALWGLGVHIGPLSAFVEALQTHSAFSCLDLGGACEVSMPTVNLEGGILCHLVSRLFLVDCSDSHWWDLGTCQELGTLLPKTSEGNHLFGEVHVEGCRECTVLNFSDIPLEVKNLRKSVVAYADDRLLVVPYGKSERIKKHFRGYDALTLRGNHVLRDLERRLLGAMILEDEPLTVEVTSIAVSIAGD
jgi:mannose-1-phosphate guanylyltransferase